MLGKKGEFKKQTRKWLCRSPLQDLGILYGEGDHIHVYTFFDSWDNFASFEKASSYDVAKDMGENEKKFWSTV